MTISGRAAGLLSIATLLAIGVMGCGHPAASRDTAGERALAVARAGRRPIGVGPHFRPGLRPSAVRGCRRALGRRRAAHVELFAADRVVLLPAGIGTLPPRRLVAGRIASARCYGPIVTLEPTGVVLIRGSGQATLGQLFGVWGAALGPRRLLSFRAAGRETVRAFVNGHAWRGPPGDIPLTRHAEIVLELGPAVPPHRSYTFPPGYTGGAAERVP